MMYLGNQAIGINNVKEITNLLQVVYRFTPESTTGRFIIPNFGYGFYCFCEEPALTSDKALEESYPNYALQCGSFVVYYGSNGAMGITRGSTSVIRSSGTIDAWGSYASLVNNNENIEIGGSASNNNIAQFIQGHTYVVLKTTDMSKEVTPNA